MAGVSVSPTGEAFDLPETDDYGREIRRVETLVDAARGRGSEIVVVMGVGFVGAVMAAIVADSVDPQGRSKFVIGCDLPIPQSFWKIPVLNRGQSPVKAEDPEVEPLIARCVREKRTLTATFNNDCLGLADCVVVDVQCDYRKADLGKMRTGEVDMRALEATFRTIGRKIPAQCLVLIETTVAPGTTEFVAFPIIRKEFGHRSGISGGSAPGARRRRKTGWFDSSAMC